MYIQIERIEVVLFISYKLALEIDIAAWTHTIDILYYLQNPIRY